MSQSRSMKGSTVLSPTTLGWRTLTKQPSVVVVVVVAVAVGVVVVVAVVVVVVLVDWTCFLEIFSEIPPTDLPFLEITRIQFRQKLSNWDSSSGIGVKKINLCCGASPISQSNCGSWRLLRDRNLKNHTMINWLIGQRKTHYFIVAS